MRAIVGSQHADIVTSMIYHPDVRSIEGNPGGVRSNAESRRRHNGRIPAQQGDLLGVRPGDERGAFGLDRVAVDAVSPHACAIRAGEKACRASATLTIDGTL